MGVFRGYTSTMKVLGADPEGEEPIVSPATYFISNHLIVNLRIGVQKVIALLYISVTLKNVAGIVSRCSK